jgi:hypothetical protein
MDVMHRKTGFEKLLDSVKSSKAVKSGLVAAGGLIGLTAGSAAVSARRRREEEAGG